MPFLYRSGAFFFFSFFFGFKLGSCRVVAFFCSLCTICAVLISLKVLRPRGSSAMRNLSAHLTSPVVEQITQKKKRYCNDADSKALWIQNSRAKQAYHKKKKKMQSNMYSLSKCVVHQSPKKIQISIYINSFCYSDMAMLSII